MADVVISASCHCKASSYSFTVNESDLPLQAHLCSCNISRRISGVLATSYVSIPAPNSKPSLESLTAYRSSDILKRHFCTTCGTHMYLEYDRDGHFEVSAGTIATSDGIVQFLGHIWIADSRDGGASNWIKQIGGRKAERWLEEPVKSSQAPLNWKAENNNRETQSTADLLHARCHCGGVQFYISRPDKESLLATSPFPDLLVPYHSGASADNPENIPWWISPDGKRYLAGNCACESCRRIAGFDIVQWAFVPTTNITLVGGEPFRRGFGSLKTYTSSSAVERHFCRVCGATAFWDGRERPTLLDVAVGLLDAKSGALAEEFLDWVGDRVSFREDAHNKELVESLEEGLGEWKQVEQHRSLDVS